MPPLEIHFFPFFSYFPSGNNDVDKPKIEKKTNNLVIIHKLLIQNRKSSWNIFRIGRELKCGLSEWQAVMETTIPCHSLFIFYKTVSNLSSQVLVTLEQKLSKHVSTCLAKKDVGQLHCRPLKSKKTLLRNAGIHSKSPANLV